ncbi:hypothetical protein BCR43DRAFT_489363 [Syncephalastrum racemosum]|uniref:Uncharacterized protein n=1 Tax=Syncephalastrum racemosum TaxID=13706 RepID=A0A1X2HE15_SYNRA|nr:hypothetical protein BCR43DRAFT_489363 [Syncephalastrum racemosum]
MDVCWSYYQNACPYDYLSWGKEFTLKCPYVHDDAVGRRISESLKDKKFKYAYQHMVYNNFQDFKKRVNRRRAQKIRTILPVNTTKSHVFTEVCQLLTDRFRTLCEESQQLGLSGSFAEQRQKYNEAALVFSRRKRAQAELLQCIETEKEEIPVCQTCSAVVTPALMEQHKQTRMHDAAKYFATLEQYCCHLEKKTKLEEGTGP